MNIDWRYLLTEARIPWKDRGRNCSRGHINITCPWCHDDPSEHLTINEENGLYFCLRNSDHKGGPATFLLEAAGISRVRATLMVEDARRDGPVPSFTTVARKDSLRAFTSKWETFESVATNDTLCTYLRWRGIDDPRLAASLFDLRTIAGGAHAQRVLIPMYDASGVSGWTGRTITSRIPKYLAHCAEPGLSLAGVLERNCPVLLVVEGPLDALKINYALRKHSIKAVALCGKMLTAGKQLLIRSLKPKVVYVVLDNDTALSKTMQMVAELATACPTSRIKRGGVPVGWKDPGEMTCRAIEDWAHTMMEMA